MDNKVTVKAYGIALHSKFLEIQCLQDQLIEGGTISVENQPYQIISVMEDSSGQFSVNVKIQ